MPTTVIQNSIVAGAAAGLAFQRQQGSFVPGDYAPVALAARAIANECIIRNAALTAPMDDVNNAQIGPLCAGIAFGVCAGIGSQSTLAADYLSLANNIVALCKQSVAQLI